MKLIFSDEAWEDYLYWQEQDRRMVARINRLINETRRNPFKGTGKPEPLKHALAAVHAAEVYYRFKRSWSAFVYKGRIDYQVTHRYLEVHQPKLSGLGIRAAKLALYAAMGRVGWADMKASMGHCWGSYLEARATRRKGIPGGQLARELAGRASRAGRDSV